MNSSDLESLITKLIQSKTLIQAVLSNPRKKSKTKKVLIRPVHVKGQAMFQVSDHLDEKVIHTNVSEQQCQDIIKERLLHEFKQCLLCSPDADYQVLSSKKQQITILERPPSQSLQDMAHNRQKRYLLEENTPIPFLIALGVMNHEGKVYPHKRNKFRQLNRFVEMVDDILPFLDRTKTLSIIDFGCGKSYLTFALYYYLHDIHKLPIEIMGLDLKADVVQFCQSVADSLHCSGLHFSLGDINEQQPTKKVDMVISLHACDTATDAALEKAVRLGADVILSVPCCQHEVFNQVHSPLLTPILKHGVLKERFAALITDAARAQLLTILGYSTQLLEFIETEHTPKNLLIRAVLSPKQTVEKSREEYLVFKKTLNIFPSLEKRFQKELGLW